MKLYQIKLPARVTCECSDGSHSITVKRIDGSYSYCTSELGNIVHLYACTELHEMPDGSWAIAPSNPVTLSPSAIATNGGTP